MIHKDSTDVTRLTIHGTPNSKQGILQAQPRIQHVLHIQMKVNKIRKGLVENALIQTSIKTINKTLTPIIFVERTVSERSSQSTQPQVALSQSENADIDPHIISISSRDLNEIEIKLLEKGLKFTPTPQRNTTDLIKDTEEFFRRLRLRDFFSVL